MSENAIDVIVKWNSKEYEIKGLSADDTVIELKQYIEKETGVRPERQKLLNVKLKGKPADDDCALGSLSFKPNFKIMMMGSLEEAIQEASSRPLDMDDVKNDLDIEDEDVAIECAHVYLQKVEKRVRDYNITMISEPRPGKKLLVLDIDYTLFDHRSAAETGYELMRPFLHEFLTSAYQHYDIVIWSATGMKWIEEKMKLLGVNTHQSYKILFYLDYLAMITVQSPKYGIVLVKPLGVIWGKFRQYSPKNTIMFDDVRCNFIMNPQTGLKIRAFRQAHLNRDKDRELLYLSTYLKDIAVHCEDFTLLNHKRWEKYRAPSSSRDKKQGSSKRKADDDEDVCESDKKVE